MKEEMKNAVIELVIRIELSDKNPHWKANKKNIAQIVDVQCSHCEQCQGSQCPQLRKFLQLIANIQKELAA